MKYYIETSRHFDKAFRKCIKRGLDPNEFRIVAGYLEETGTVPRKYKPHKLSGKWNNLWECHIQPDWLLIWEKNEQTVTIILIDTGTHSDLFK